MRARRVAIGVVIAGAIGAFTSGSAAGDTTVLEAPLNLHMRTPSHVQTDGGADVRLPAGWFLDESSYAALDTETKRLQDAETRLAAENASLKQTAAGWQPGWYTLAIAVAGGLVLGYEIEKHL